MQANIFKKVLNYFLTGVFYTIPIAITIWVIVKVFNWLDGMTKDLIPQEYNFPGLGIVFLLITFTVIGFLSATLLDKHLKNTLAKGINNLLSRVPFLKTIYSSTQDMTAALVGKKKSFTKPVLVKISGSADLEQLGFMTREGLELLGVEGAKATVYLPFPYNYSGTLVVAPVKNITPLNVKSSEVMKFILSGGISEIEKKEEKVSFSVKDELD